MSTSIFGTDGVRGTPGEYPLDEQTITRLGAATARVLEPAHPRLLIARDTRESGRWIEKCLAAGVAAENGLVVSVGVVPTPATVFLSSSPEFDAGFVISASHNPCPDNGIKLLTGDGVKASDDLEMRLSAVVADRSWHPPVVPSAPRETREMLDPYVAHMCNAFSDVDAGRIGRVALDCANGATCVTAPLVFRKLGFEVVALNVEPNGRNINDRCGSTHPEGLQQVVRNQMCQLGVAFDGDGDRAILVDGNGEVVDGDAVLYICATHLASHDRLPGRAVVATVMSNIALEAALRAAGIVVHRCPVGDREVFGEMRRQGIVLGGEQSGHIIFSQVLSTGDGLLTVLSVLTVMNETGRGLADLRSRLEVFPQVLVNVPVKAKPALEAEPAIIAAIQEAEETLGTDGRVLVRYSGTEPVLRIMIEGRDEAMVGRLVSMIAQKAHVHLG